LTRFNGDRFRIIKRATVGKQGIVFDIDFRRGSPDGRSDERLSPIVPLLSDESTRVPKDPIGLRASP
jgi:hypothetical protein